MRKNKANVIKFYPFGENQAGFTPEPIPASKSIPDWYKRQVAEIKEATNYDYGQVGLTVKKCMPIFDAMTAGYYLLAPCDIFLDATGETLKYSVPMAVMAYKSDMFSSHDRKQYDEYPIDSATEHKDLLRIMPFYSVETPPGYAALILNPMHGDTGPLRAVQGFIDTDKFITDGHFSFVVKKNFKGIIKQGTPLAQVIPIRREDWEMQIVPQAEADKIIAKQRLKLRSMFTNGYKTLFRTPKVFK